MKCPAGCGHAVDRHSEVRVAFNHAMSCNAGKVDYDAMGCHYAEMTVDKNGWGRYTDCRCLVPAGGWARLLKEPKQRRLFK